MRGETKRPVPIERSSGNVFADLGFPDAEIRLVKADLARHLTEVISARGLTQREAAALMGLSQPDVSDLRRGLLNRFSQERLERCLNRLGFDVAICVSAPAPAADRPGVTTVRFD